MKKKMVSVLMLALILTSTLGMAFVIRSSLAENDGNNIFDKDCIGKTGETVLQNEADKLDQTEGFDSSWYDVFERKPEAEQEKTLESLSPTLRNDGDDWNFNDTSEWSNFTYVNGNETRLIVGVNGEGATVLPKLEKMVEKYQAKIVNMISIKEDVRAVIVELPLISMTAFIDETRTLELASYIEPDMKVQTQLVPNDPYWNMQWGPQKIEADWAWNTTVGNPSVLVAVVDSGVDYTHPDLEANYVPLGYDWVNLDEDPLDDFGHGTHCAGIIAAVLNNSVGIAGLAQVQVMAEKVVDSWGWGYLDWVASGIIHATDCGADIISLSLGTYYDSELVHEAVRYAYDAGVLVVAAAGNEATNMKLYPAGYDEVIAVAATDQYDNTAYWSNYGEWIELAAPGVDIYSTMPTYYVTMNDWGYSMSYSYMSGTSMACPHVAGVAALIWSLYPNKTRGWVRLWLRYTADDLGEEGFDVYYGYGRINAREAVEQTPPAHELIAYEWRTPLYVEPEALGIVNATILNFAENNETDIMVQLFANGTMVDSAVIGFLASGNSTTVSLAWNPTIEGLYNVTLYVVPVPGETNLENNVLWKYIYVGFPLKAFVLHSAGNVFGDIITNWQVLNSEWRLFGDVMIYIDYTTLNKEDITYEDIAATEADVLIISCAYDPYAGWEFTDSEIEAIERYVHEGHGLIATAGTLYYGVPNNNKLAPLFGLNETTMWDATGTDLLHLVNTTHPIFTNVPNPLVFPYVGTALPYDGRWDSNELVGGEYLALGHYQESAIVTFRGLVYISPWLEVIPPYYHHHLQLLYNTITWSCYQKPEHDLAVSLDVPPYLEPDNSSLLNATVYNRGLSNETDVTLQLLINGSIVDSLVIPELLVEESCTLSYLWTPTTEATFNITAYTPPVPNEEDETNNVASNFVRVRSIIGTVVFEEAHFPAYTIGSNPAYDVTGGYSEFANYLEVNGYIVFTIDPGTTINSTVLASADVLVIVAPQDSYLETELDAIENWVKEGGSLLLIGDWTYFGSQARVIASRFNVNLRGDGICDSDENVGQPLQPYYDGTNLLDHPVTEGVSRVEIYAGDGITTAPAMEMQLIVTDDDGTAYWYSDYSLAISISVMSAFDGGVTGSGRLIIMTDSNVWDSAYDVDYDGDVDFYDSDNEILAINSINWLSTQYEHDIAVSLEAPTFLEPGDSSLLNATVYNKGLNNETNVDLFILINGTELSSAVIPELLTEASYTLSCLWTPTTEATYNITAYAPPVPGENITLNNARQILVSVKILPDILIVNDDDGGNWISGTSLTEFESALAVVGYDYWVWNESSMGNPSLDFLSRFELVIWTCGDYWSWAVDPIDAETLEAYLTQGGNILLEGEDIGYNHDADDFMINVAHAIMQVDDTGAPGLTVTDASHPVTFNLPPSFNWLTNPPYDDGVSPTNGGAEVVQYTGTTWTAVTVFEGTSGGSVVYYAFPLYALPESYSDTLAINSVNWLLGIGFHDVAIVDVTPSTNEVVEGESVEIEVTAENQGNFTETFNVTAYAVYQGNSTSTSYTLNSLSSLPTIYVDPPEILNQPPSSTFTIGVKISNVTDLYGFDILFRWNPGLLEYINHSVRVPKDYYPDGVLWAPIFKIKDEINTTAGTYWIVYASMNPAPSFNGSGTFFYMTFHVKGVGSCYLSFDSTTLVSSQVLPISHNVQTGYFSNYELPPPIIIGTTLVSNLTSGGRATLAFNWNTTGVSVGNYSIYAEASVVPFEANKENNVFYDGIISITPAIIRDIAILNVTAYPSAVYAGRIVSITVLTANNGNMTETFNVTVYANTTIIGVQSVTLDPWSNTTLTFQWNTTGLTPCSNFTIWAEASEVPYEVNVDNNIFTDGWVKIKILGDINGDGAVDLYDAVLLHTAYGSREGDPKWNPEADLAPEWGIINLYDAVTLLYRYGQSC